MKCKKNEICISFAKTVRPLAAMTKYESERLSHKYNLENNFFFFFTKKKLPLCRCNLINWSENLFNLNYSNFQSLERFAIL
jgi:hypothetical protein